MDAVLIAAVSVVGVLGLLNLLLVLAVVRRLREYGEKWARAGLDRLTERMLAPEVGSHVADFTATATDGAEVSLRGEDAPLLAGFFSAGCLSCRAELAGFVDYAGALPGGRERSLAVISGSVEQGADIIEAVQAVARVIVEPPDGAVVSAFGVRTSPTFVLLGQDGTIQDWVSGVRELAPIRGATS